MAKKRRNTTTPQDKGPRGIDPEDANIGPIRSWEDVANSEDEFHMRRDKVLLEEGDVRDELETSDEEVLRLEYSDPDDDEDDISSSSSGDEGEEEEEEGWGNSKKTYYNDPHAPEEAEESEALRLQRKHLASLSTGDFLFDPSEWSAAPTAPATTTTRAVEHLPTVPASALPETDRAKRLHRLHPEFAPLACEFAALEPLHASLGLSAAAAEAVGETLGSSVAMVKFRALSAYLGVLSMYFAVLTSGKEDGGGGEGVREHGVMEGLVKCRGMWEAVKGLEVEEINSRDVQKRGKEGKKPEPERKRVRISTAAVTNKSEPPPDTAKTPRSIRSEEEKDEEPDVEIDFEKPTPTAFSTTTTAAKHQPHSQFGEDSTLSHPEAHAKSTKKRSLRYHTSRIVSKSLLRSAAANHHGDTDVPHRERARDRTQRTRREDTGADLGGHSSSENGGDDTATPARGGRVNGDDDEDDEYVRFLRTSKSRKADKKAAHDAARDLLRAGTAEGEESTGKRSVGYTIAKNKGLTPFRKKDVRNPRVRGRNKYEAAKKRLASRRAVYGGGLKGAYGGEATGIKANLVKSVKFA